jgi:hypothetical protein
VTLPLAHIGHWLWTFYLIPVLIVVGAILKSKRSEKKDTPDTDDPPSDE